MEFRRAKEVTGSLGSSAEIQAKIKKNEWNDYVVIGRAISNISSTACRRWMSTMKSSPSASNRASSRCSFMRASR